MRDRTAFVTILLPTEAGQRWARSPCRLHTISPSQDRQPHRHAALLQQLPSRRQAGRGCERDNGRPDGGGTSDKTIPDDLGPMLIALVDQPRNRLLSTQVNESDAP